MAARQKPYGGVYENLDYEKIYGTYVYQEYPKAINTGPHGANVVVNSAAEERELRTRLKLEVENAPPPAPEYVPDPAKQILITRAYELSVPINQKWSVGKLQAVIAAAEKELDELPAETPYKPGQLPAAPVSFDDEPPAPEPVANELLQASTAAARPKLALAASPDVEAEKDKLIARCKELGVSSQGMNLWGLPRLRATVVEAEAKL